MACTVCRRNDRKAIEADLERLTLRAVGEKYGLNRETLRRHRVRCATVSRPAPRAVAAPVVEVSRLPTAPRPRVVLRGRLLEEAEQGVSDLHEAIESLGRDLADPDLGLRDRQTVCRTLAMLRREARGYLELASRVGALEAPDVDVPDDPTVEDVERILASIQDEMREAG